MAKKLGPAQILYRLNKRLCEKVIRLSANPRPMSLPFISGDTFRGHSDHVYEHPEPTLDAAQVKDGDAVFVEVDLIERFFRDVHVGIRHPYVLITHNGDLEIDARLADLMDGRIKAWFAQNVLVKRERLVPIPIGLENAYYCGNGVVKNFQKAKASVGDKKNRIIYGFSVGTNPKERGAALGVLEKLPVADRLSGWPTPKKYLKTLSQYKFVASPPGNGVDCHRTWEAMAVRTVPVVKRSVMTEYFFGLGLPMLLIDDWQELNEFNEEVLATIYDGLVGRFSSPYLYFEAWNDKIKLACK